MGHQNTREIYQETAQCNLAFSSLVSLQSKLEAL